MRITRLKGSVPRPGYVAVFVDGARFALLPVEEVRALGLAEGLALAGSGQAALEAAAERAKAYDAAVRLLAVRGRSRQEIIVRLRRKQIGKDAIAHAVGRLEEAGLLDDGAFAREYARTQRERGFGRTRILADLARRGVERREAERAVAEVGGDQEDEQRRTMLAVARKRAAQLKGLDRVVARRRLMGYLARRGYGGEAWRVVADVIDESRADSPRSAKEPDAEA